MKTLDAIYFSTHYIDYANLPKTGSYIIASNHISNLDPFVLGICDRRKFSFLAKEELFKKKIIGFLFREMGAFPIKRDTSDFGALREALRRLKSGRPLILFPEGTRGVTNRQKQAQPGIGFIVAKSQLPVVPVFVKGTDKALPNDAKWFRRHPVTVRIGQPIHIHVEDKKDYPLISKKILDEIYALE